MLKQANLRVRRDENIVWQYMKPTGRPSFTNGLLKDMNELADTLLAEYDHTRTAPDFVVTAGGIPGVFNLGGDLELFSSLIAAKDEFGLRKYAHTTTFGQYRIHTSYSLPMTMVAFVEGDALGGGFEAALAHDLIVARKGTSFGFPEVLFGLFPGMGAYSFLSRRVGMAQADRMIGSGKVFRAEELHDIGVVDLVVDDDFDLGEYLKAMPHGRRARLRSRKVASLVGLRELLDIANLWVDAALKLSARDLRRMSHLVRAQDRRMNAIAA